MPRAGELLTFPGDYSEMVADECTPSHYYLALELVPIALNEIPIHINPP
jgi:hypothetical protein